MEKQPSQKRHVRVQKVVAEDITDPDEIARLEASAKRYKALRRGLDDNCYVNGDLHEVALIMDLWQMTPEANRPDMLAKLLACLTPEQQLETFGRIATRLPLDTLHQFEEAAGALPKQ